jgi:hypothetical protein
METETHRLDSVDIRNLIEDNIKLFLKDKSKALSRNALNEIATLRLQ